MSTDIAIVDYGIGNLLSVSRAFARGGANISVTDQPDALLAADGMVLPGVGAFADGMRGLIGRGLDKVVLDYVASGRPLIGICLGMQLMASVGEEFGEHAGLGIIPGRVSRIASVGADGRPHKVPHVGWADLEPSAGPDSWHGTVLDGIRNGEAVYLTHSFALQPADASHRLADYRYNGVRVTAAVRRGNVTGVQFHPEKSGEVGLRIVANFVRSARREQP